jgi:hypothetical protein
MCRVPDENLSGAGRVDRFDLFDERRVGVRALSE